MTPRMTCRMSSRGLHQASIRSSATTFAGFTGMARSPWPMSESQSVTRPPAVMVRVIALTADQDQGQAT